MPGRIGKRWLPRIAVIAVLTICAVTALVLWQERGLRVARQRLASGDPAAALAAVDQFLARHPGHRRALALRAQALVPLGDAEEAARLFDQVGAAEPEELRAWAEALLALRRWRQALPRLQRLQQLEPDDARTLETLTICHFELGQHQAALQSAQRLAELPGHEAAGYFQLGSIQRDLGSQVIASHHFEKVLQHDPQAKGLPVSPAVFYLTYGDTALAAGRARKALQLLERSEQLRPSVDVTLREGQAWHLMGNYERSEELLREVVAQDPDHRTAARLLAEAALQRQDAEAAVRWLKPVSQSEAADSHVAHLLCRAYTQLEDAALARQWQEKAAALRRTERRLAALKASAQRDPQAPRARLIAAYMAAADGNWQVSGQLLAALLRAAPDVYQEPFVQQLIDAVRHRAELPALESLPTLERSRATGR